MPSITIDGKTYDSDSLSDKAKEQIMSLQFVNAEIKRLESQLAVCKTASAAYSLALKNEIAKMEKAKIRWRETKKLQ